MKVRSKIIVAVLAVGSAAAQVASHAPTVVLPGNTAPGANVQAMVAKPVAKVNGAVLTELDLTREMYTMFPYAQQHGGVPKSMEADIRKGAMEMIIFEELLYQEAKRRGTQIAPEKLNKAVAAFRKQFPSNDLYEQYLSIEFSGSPKVLREKIRRSLLIEQMLKSEVTSKAAVTPVSAKAYYDKNPKMFEHGETVAIQTVSIVPPENPTAALQKEAKAKITDILRLARATKTPREFGQLAEQVSEDDWRMKMGDRGTMDVKNLPAEVVKAARTMKVGEVSDIIQLGRAFVVFRLNAHTPAGKTPFAEAKQKLQSELQKQRSNERRTELNQQLHKGATIEIL
jgi:peptidyl-prolyl cis-trans isomerase SurA